MGHFFLHALYNVSQIKPNPIVPSFLDHYANEFWSNATFLTKYSTHCIIFMYGLFLFVAACTHLIINAACIVCFVVLKLSNVNKPENRVYCWSSKWCIVWKKVHKPCIFLPTMHQLGTLFLPTMQHLMISNVHYAISSISPFANLELTCPVSKVT